MDSILRNLASLRKGTAWLIVGGACLLAFGAMAEDWPTFRHDNARSALTAEQLDAPLALQWVFTPICGPDPAWPEEGKEKDRVRFDEAFHVAVVGDAVYFGSSSDNKVYCLDAATGAIRWTAFVGGPVRVAPTVADGRVYVGSDDGCAYCWRASDGAPVWKVKAPFRDDKVLGNGKMISLWPVRTGVLVDNGIAYFGAGVFPHETLYLYAVKADDGTVIWRNDTYGEEGYKLDFGGISPQGPLLASDSTVFVPSGRAMPAAFNRADGRFQYYASADHIGGAWALLTDDRVVAGTYGKREYDQEKGSQVKDAAYAWFPGLQLVVSPDSAYMATTDELAALDRKAFKAAGEWRGRIEAELKPLNDQLKVLDASRGKTAEDQRAALDAQRDVLRKQIQNLEAERGQVENAVHRWRRPCALRDALIQAGDCLYVGGRGAVLAARAKTGEDVWQAPVEGRACGLAVANGRLFVSTDTGKIYGFAKAQAEPRTVAVQPDANAFPQDEFGALCAKAAEEIVAITGVTKGYCLVLDSGTGRLAYELAKRSELRIVGVDPDVKQVEASRKALDAAGVYGSRVVVDEGDLATLPYADYFANLIVSERVLKSDVSAANREEFLRLLKPHGGIACFGAPAEAAVQGEPPDLAKVQAWLEPHGAFTADVTTDRGKWIKVTRGELKGEGKWTHQYADTGNTACSDDELVKGALGVLWFGRPGPSLMVERHSRPAAPVAMDGRMFVQGENVVMAYDAYNGVNLWEQKVPGAVRVRVDSDMSDLALEKDGLYVATDDKCIRLNPATGETVRTYGLPPHEGKPQRWGYIACTGHTLFGSIAAPMREDYGEIWRDLVGENGEWGDVNAALAKRKTEGVEDLDHPAQFVSRHAKPDDGAFWEAQQSGMMWRMMSPWPAWGSVTTPEGAVTDRIMSSDVLFAYDTESGALLWKYDGKAIAHPAIAIGDGTVFLADCNVTEEQKLAAMQERQGLIAKGTWEKEDITYDAKAADARRVVALDAATGAKRWERIIDLTGCGGDRMGLGYKDGVLCFFGCFSNHDRRFFREGKLAWRRITAVSGKDGADLWSRPLNYLRRPVIMGDTILIEPRACALHTGAIKNRLHPLTGLESTWEFVRPGHCCSITSAAKNMFFLRGYFLWYYDPLKDQGMLPFGGIRPGCWINVIPANGLVLFPEASAGCTCSYPVRSTVVLQPKTEPRTYALCVQHGNMTPVRHMAVNFGAPGDWRDDAGTLWFAYPHPPSTDFYQYGVNFALDEQFASKPAYFARNADGAGTKSTDKPWLFASGAKGITSFTLPLLDEGQGPATYTVRLYFTEPEQTAPGKRVFAVKLQDKPVLRDFDIMKEAGGPQVALVKEFTGIKVEKGLRVELTPKEKDAEPDAQPVISAIEAIREDAKVAQAN